MDENNVILLKDVTRSFGEKQVLKGVSLEINKGEIFGLLGPSGAGKTTIINILTGQLSCGGKAEIFGVNCGKIGREVYRRTGAVLDNCGLYERLSCADNLRLYASIHRVSSSGISEALALVGLDGCEHKKVKALSKGMKQRLCIARAIFGLDPATASVIHALMSDLRRNGTTIFLTTHNMDEAYRMCDRIALLSDGTIVECGEPGELCRRHCSTSELSIVTTEEERITLTNMPENADEVAGLIRGGRLKSIHSSEPDLGTVFIRLTGKELDK